MFLEDKVLIKVLSTKTISAHFRLTRIANFCKKNYAENERKREKIDFIWKNEQANLISKFSKDGSEKVLKKEQNLINFDSDLKKQIISDYLDR